MIRQAVRSDLPAVYRLICDLEETTFSEEMFIWGYEAMTADPNHLVLVAEENEKVIGVLHLRMEFQLHHCAKIAEILEFMVCSEYRSRGVGKQLLIEAMAAAKEHHCVQIEVTSNQKRSKAHQFYQREAMQLTHVKLTKALELYSDTNPE